jgi:cell wall-associated NlpC family hydrolase
VVIMAKHRRPKESRTAPRAGAAFVVGGATAAAAVISSGGTASAASVGTWDKVAKCESGNRWNINTGNGYYGGLQFSASTWNAYRPSGYPGRADLASKTQQILVAEKVLKAQGPGAWPVCSVRAGLTRGGPPPSLAPAKPRPRPAPGDQTRAAKAIAYAASKISSAPYLYGGNGPTRFDCSGLTSQAWLHAGVRIPRTSMAQLAGLPRVNLSSIRPGDLVIYSFRSHADHVALYAGNGRTIDTASSHVNGGVGYSKLHRAGGTIAGVVRPAGSTAAPAPRTQPKAAPGPKLKYRAVPTPAPDRPAAPAKLGTYEVKAGDTLSSIAREHGLRTWKTIYALNRGKIKDPDLIYPGQVFRLPGGARIA